jgi:6-phosphogluconolactonase
MDQGQSFLNSNDEGALLFVGTYTDGGKSQGIYIYRMDKATGALLYVSALPKTTNPSYVAIHPNHQWIYTVNELGGSNEKYEGAVSAFSLNPASKQFEFINTVPSHGNYPCHISVDKTGHFVMVANYGNGSVAVYPVRNDGGLADASCVDQHRGAGPNAKRQEGPHAHMITQGSDPRFVYNTDLGTDKIFVYKLDTVDGKLLPTDVNYSSQLGAGPRHMAFHPNQKWAYCINELNGTIEACLIDKTTGALTRMQTISTLPEGEKRDPGSADIHITPNGKFLYATNRGDINNIAMFAVNQKSGKLQLMGHQSTKGKTPRNFVIDPTGSFLLVANQNTSNVVTFRIDPQTGKLKDTGIETAIPSPVCLKFLEQ